CSTSHDGAAATSRQRRLGWGSVPAGALPDPHAGNARCSTAETRPAYVRDLRGARTTYEPDTHAAPAPTALSPPDADAAVTPTPAPARSRILLADDNADMRHYVRQLLSDRYDIHVVADGAEALAAVRAHKLDLVLADVMMPGLDGFGLLAALRHAPRRT